MRHDSYDEYDDPTELYYDGEDEDALPEQSDGEFEDEGGADFGEVDDDEEGYEDDYRDEAVCAACETPARVDEQGLCDQCAEKLERDFIRLREWSNSRTAAACPREKLEELRRLVIARYGAKMELIGDSKAQE